MKSTHRYKVVDDDLKVYEGNRKVFDGHMTQTQKVALIKELADSLRTVDWRDL
jgi:hypothetical protein